MILIATVLHRWKQTESNSFLQDFCAFTEILRKNPAFCGQYLGGGRGIRGTCIFLHCYFVHHQNRRRFDNSKRLSCAFVLSGDVVVLSASQCKLRCLRANTRLSALLYSNLNWHDLRIHKRTDGVHPLVHNVGEYIFLFSYITING